MLASSRAHFKTYLQECFIFPTSSKFLWVYTEGCLDLMSMFDLSCIRSVIETFYTIIIIVIVLGREGAMRQAFYLQDIWRRRERQMGLLVCNLGQAGAPQVYIYTPYSNTCAIRKAGSWEYFTGSWRKVGSYFFYYLKRYTGKRIVNAKIKSSLMQSNWLCIRTLSN